MGNTILALTILGCVLVTQGTRPSPASMSMKREPRLSLLKEMSNQIEPGPEYVSHHKRGEILGHKAVAKHAWKHNKKAGHAKKYKKGSQGLNQPANTRYDQDNIHLQRLDYQPITRKKKMPKKMIEKEKLRLKKKYLKKLQKKHVP